jgi:hypothetical protein
MSVQNIPLSPFWANSRNPFNYAKIEQTDRDVSTAWLTLEECTQQLNLFDDESQDTYISSIELATRMAIEDYLGLTIFPITYKVYYGDFGSYNNSNVYLDLPEVSEAGITINSVQCYTNSNTVPETISSSNYSYDPTGNRVILSDIPNEINENVANPIVVTYTTNASPIAQYPVVKQAGLMLLTHIYNNRSATSERLVRDIPYGVAMLLRSYKPLVM